MLDMVDLSTLSKENIDKIVLMNQWEKKIQLGSHYYF